MTCFSRRQIKISFDFVDSSRTQQIATGDYLTRKFLNLVRHGGHDKELSGGGEGWHGKKGGNLNIETFVQQLYFTLCLSIEFDGNKNLTHLRFIFVIIVLSN